MSFYQSIRELNRYRRTRLAWSMSLPLATFLGIASLAGEEVTASDVVLRVVLAWLLVVPFRLGNDLRNVKRDQREHRDRVLVQSRSLLPFYLILAVMVLANGLLLGLLRSPAHVVTFAALGCLTLAAWVMPARLWPRLAYRYHFLLIKYPLFVALIGTRSPFDPPQAKLFATALVYFCFCVYEGLHDVRLRSDRLATATFHIDNFALAAVAAGMAWRLNARSIAALPIQAGLVGAGAVILILTTLLVYRQRLQAPGRSCYAVFAPCFLWLWTCTL
ncbi:MAG: hypothetical protein FJ295_04630 [Planctomycetes bacterium]|nr:hypothetical protein [Planctomycetota bacterium]